MGSPPEPAERHREDRAATCAAPGCAGVTVASAALALVAGLVTAPAASAQGSAPGAPGANATWNEPSVTGFADSLGSSSKVWYTIGNGELENAFYPETDTPDTFGLQYVVTNGSSFTETETTGTTHAVSLINQSSLVWQQVNTADNGDFTITKTYIADPSRSVILVQTTFDNTSSSALKLYVDYHPQLDNDGMGNTGDTDSASGNLVAENGSVASALTASTGFTQSDNGYVGTSSDGETMLTSSYGLTSTYSQASTAGHIDQVAEIPVASSGSTTFTLALAFDTTEAAAISDASASLSAGFSSLESSFESGWQSWLNGLNAAPASVTGSAGLKEQYYVSLMELKADEDKTYTGAFIAAPTVPWGASVSADTGTGTSGAHGYHAVWTRDEYEMATTLLAAGDKTDALAALNYIFSYEVESSGAVKQNTWLNGTAVFGSVQMDEVADPIILAYQLGATGSSDWSYVEELANYLVANGPYTLEERWEEIGGYSPATMAAEIAGLICAASIAEANNDPSAAETYQATAQAWASEVDDLTYTTTGPYGSGDYLLRITPDGQPNAGTSITIANGGGSHDDRTVVDPSFLELVRLGVKSPSAADITNTISAVDSELEVSTPEGPIWHRYNFDGYGETSSGGDYTGSGVGNPWPVLTGERGEYDVADGNLSGRPVHAGDDARGGQRRIPDLRAGLGRLHRHRRVHLRPGGQLLHPADVGDGAVRQARHRHLGGQGRGHPFRGLQLPAAELLPGDRDGEGNRERDRAGEYRRLRGHGVPGREPLRARLRPVGLGLERHRDDPRQLRRVDHDRLRDCGHDAVLQVRPGRQLEQRRGDRRLRFGQQPLDVRQRRHGERHGGQLGGSQCLR